MDKDSKSNMKSDSRLIENAIAYITDLFRSDSGGHDAEHTLRVFRNAQIIAQKETRCSERIVSLAALLHDADDHKLFHTENNANARRFLSENQVPEEEIGRSVQRSIPSRSVRIRGGFPKHWKGR